MYLAILALCEVARANSLLVQHNRLEGVTDVSLLSTTHWVQADIFLAMQFLLDQLPKMK